MSNNGFKEDLIVFNKEMCSVFLKINTFVLCFKKKNTFVLNSFVCENMADIRPVTNNIKNQLLKANHKHIQNKEMK